MIGLFPDILKFACITPLHKSGFLDDAGIYQPISVLYYSVKLLKNLWMFGSLIISKNSIFCQPDNLDFRKVESCSDVIFRLTEYIYAYISDKEHVVSVFLDLKKAYDTVNHNILCWRN